MFFNSCSGATLARVTGVEFCVDMSIPGDEEKTNAPHFPLTGPSKFALSVLKRDSHTSYKFELKNSMVRKCSYMHFLLYFNKLKMESVL
jgi:hypothetical protein